MSGSPAELVSDDGIALPEVEIGGGYMPEDGSTRGLVV